MLNRLNKIKNKVINKAFKEVDKQGYMGQIGIDEAWNRAKSSNKEKNPGLTYKMYSIAEESTRDISDINIDYAFKMCLYFVLTLGLPQNHPNTILGFLNSSIR